MPYTKYFLYYNILDNRQGTYSFDNQISNFMKYVSTKMPTKKKYAIQDYSNDGNMYIYQIKYTDDLLATGLTNRDYTYTEEKMIFKTKSAYYLILRYLRFLSKNVFSFFSVFISLFIVQKFCLFCLC